MASDQVIPACPECGKDDFTDMRGRGTHMRFKHNIEGKSAKYNHPKRKYKKRNVEQFPNQQEVDLVFENQISFAYGHCDAWLEIYASSIGISKSALAGRVAELLQDASSRSILGTGNKVSTMRPKAA